MRRAASIALVLVVLLPTALATDTRAAPYSAVADCTTGVLACSVRESGNVTYTCDLTTCTADVTLDAFASARLPAGSAKALIADMTDVQYTLTDHTLHPGTTMFACGGGSTGQTNGCGAYIQFTFARPAPDACYGYLLRTTLRETIGPQVWQDTAQRIVSLCAIQGLQIQVI